MPTKILIPIILVILVLATGIILLAGGIWNPAWNPFQKTADDFIEKSIEKTFSADTFRAEGLVQLGLEGKIKLGLESKSVSDAKSQQLFQAVINFSGLTNQKDKLKPAGSIDLNASLQGQGMQFSAGAELKIFPDSLYLKINSLPAFLMLDPSGDIQNKWFKVDLAKLKEAQKETVDQLNPDQQKQLLRDIKDLVSGRKIFVLQDNLGREKLEKISANHYLVSLDKETLKKLVPDFFQMMEKYVPESERDSYNKNMRELLKNLPEQIDLLWQQTGGLTFDIWIADGYMVKFKWSKTFDLSNYEQLKEKIEGGKVSVLLDINYSDFNKPVDIQEPKDAKSIEDMLDLSSFGAATNKAKDARIMAAVAQSRTVMIYLEGNDGNFDSFNCANTDMKPLCDEISKEGGSLMNIAKAPAKGSNSACVWAKLISEPVGNTGTSEIWYCADSKGVAGKTNINPANAKYCLEGKSAVCPSITED